MTSGSIRLGDVELQGLSDKQLTLLRRDRIGFIFQAFNLHPHPDRQENIELPLAWPDAQPIPSGCRVVDTRRPGAGSPPAVGTVWRPAALRGGPCRALANKPDVILPTNRPGTWTPHRCRILTFHPRG